MFETTMMMDGFIYAYILFMGR